MMQCAKVGLCTAPFACVLETRCYFESLTRKMEPVLLHITHTAQALGDLPRKGNQDEENQHEAGAGI